MAPSLTPALRSAYYAASTAEFRPASVSTVIGQLTRASAFAVDPSQVAAWEREVEILQPVLAEVEGYLFLEFDVPRLGSRIDAVVLAGAALIPIEFKVGATQFLRADVDQAWDYALDLKNFHRGSHAARIFPILVATDAARSDVTWAPMHQDGVHPPRQVSADGLLEAVLSARRSAPGAALDAVRWGAEPYQPTPTIVQAARALYARHSVEAISRSDAPEALHVVDEDEAEGGGVRWATSVWPSCRSAGA